MVDLVVFLPIECQDRITLPDDEEAECRETVDQKLREFVLEDSTGLFLDTDIAEVTGSVARRAETVVGLIGRSLSESRRPTPVTFPSRRRSDDSSKIHTQLFKMLRQALRANREALERL